jgi:mono/diheme cytochrome c family protein
MVISGSRAGLLVVAAVAVILIGSGAYFFGILGWGESDTATSIDPGDLELVALGQSTYANACASCHGVNLQGQLNWRQSNADGRRPAPPHDETGHTWHHDDETLFFVTKFGSAKLIGSPVATDMPIFEGVLSDREIRAVLAFIKSRWSQDVRRRQADINVRVGAGR